MIVSTLLTNVRNKLTDTEGNFWTDSELLDYYNDANRVLSSERYEKLKTQYLAMTEDVKFYSPTGILRYDKAIDSNNAERKLYPDNDSIGDDSLGIVILDYDQIFVVDPNVADRIQLTYVGLPIDMNMNSLVRQGDIEALQYYILSLAYEKENDMENFSKSEVFKRKFDEALKKLVSNKVTNYSDNDFRTTVSYDF